MQVSQKLSGSFLFAILSLLLTLGGFLAALAENQINQPPPTITKTRTPLVNLTTSTPLMLSVLPFATTSSTPSPTPIISHPTVCPTPNGWTTYTIQPSDTLENLSEYYRILPNILKEANCLIDNSLISNTRIYVPPTTPTAIPTLCTTPQNWPSYTVQIGDTLEDLAALYEVLPKVLKETNCLINNNLIPNTRIHLPPMPTSTAILCGAPHSWAKYTVKAGDNLYRISLAYRTTVAQLQNANCLGYSTRIYVEQKLYVPNVPTSTPAITNTPPPTITQTPTSTFTATLTPTNTATATSSPTFTFIPDTP